MIAFEVDEYKNAFIVFGRRNDGETGGKNLNLELMKIPWNFRFEKMDKKLRDV